MNPSLRLAPKEIALKSYSPIFSYLQKVQGYINDLERRLAEKDQVIKDLEMREMGRALAKEKLEF